MESILPLHGRELAVGFDFEAVFAGDEAGRKEEGGGGPTLGEAQRWLRRRGLGEMEATVVILRVFDTEPIRRVAEALKKSPSWVQKCLGRHAVKEALEELNRCRRRDLPLPDVAPGPVANEGPEPGLSVSELKRRARQLLNPGSEELYGDVCDNLGRRRGASPWLRLTAAVGSVLESPSAPTRWDVMAVVRLVPGILLKKEGRPVLEALVDWLEAANYGDCGGRTCWLRAGAARKEVMREATDLLRKLTTTRKGEKMAYFDTALGWIVWELEARIQRLQRAWQETIGTGTRSGRLEAFRGRFGGDLQDLSDKKALWLLTGDPVEGACAMAAEATGIGRDNFQRAYRKKYACVAGPAVGAYTLPRPTPGG